MRWQVRKGEKSDDRIGFNSSVAVIEDEWSKAKAKEQAKQKHNGYISPLHENRE